MKSGRSVLITGASGQDAHYVAKICAARGDYVVGAGRAVLERVRYEGFDRVVPVDWSDEKSLQKLVNEVKPSEVYHLAARHCSSEVDWGDQRFVFRDNLDMATRLLSSVAEKAPKACVLLAGSCRVFGGCNARWVDEDSSMEPTDGYGAAKLAMLQLGRMYRGCGFSACTAILFNHESPLRSASYVTQKIATAAARREKVFVRDLQAQVDWGHAADYARAMVMMLGGPLDDYVVATGAKRSVLDLAQIAYQHVGLDWCNYVSDTGGGDGGNKASACNSRIMREVGWRPEISFEEMVREMVDAAKKF